MCILLKSLNELMNYNLLGVLSSTRTYNPDHEVRSFLNLHPLSSVSVGSETRLVCESPYLDVFFLGMLVQHCFSPPNMPNFIC